MYVIIVGCGRVGSTLAKLLSSEGHNVVIIDNNPNAFGRLGGTFNGVTLLGNGYNRDILESAGIERADAFCAVTNGDNTNIMSAQVAKKMFGVPRVIARVNDPRRADIYKVLGLDIISGTVLFAAMIRDKIIESKFSGYLIESGELGVIEIDVNDTINNKTVSEVNVSGELLVVTIIPNKTKEAVIPDSQAILKKGDRVVAVVRTKNLESIKRTLGIT